MLENFNDYLSFIIILGLVIASLKLLISVNFDNKKLNKEKYSILYDYENNEDD